MIAALKGGEWLAARPGRTLPPEKIRYPLYRRPGGPQGRSGRAENFVPTGIFLKIFIVHSIIYIGNNVTSASCYGSAFPIPCHLALTLAQAHSSGVEGSPPHTVSNPDIGLLLPLVLAYRAGTV